MAVVFELYDAGKMAEESVRRFSVLNIDSFCNDMKIILKVVVFSVVL